MEQGIEIERKEKGIEKTILRGGTSPLAEHKPALDQPSDNTAKHTRHYCVTEHKSALDQMLFNTNKH